MSAITIGELSLRTGVRIATIRSYEDAGLLSPPARTTGGQRRYDEDDAHRLVFIKHARRLGFEVPEVRDLVHLDDRADMVDAEHRKVAAAYLQLVRDKIERLKILEAELGRITSEARQGRRARSTLTRILDPSTPA